MVAQALVLSDGERTAAIVATDLVFVGADLAATVREQVTRSTGIPGNAVSVHAATTTARPASRAARPSVACPTFRRSSGTPTSLGDLLAGAVYAAWRRLEPARIGAAVGAPRPLAVIASTASRAGRRLAHGDPPRPRRRRRLWPPWSASPRTRSRSAARRSSGTPSTSHPCATTVEAVHPRRRVRLPAGLCGRPRAVRLVVWRLRREPARLRGA